MVETSVCESFLREREDGVHQAGDDYRLALIRRGAIGTYGAHTQSIVEVLKNGDEAFGTGYPMGGGVRLTGRKISFVGNVAELTFDDVKLGPPEGPPVTLSVEGAILYNNSRAGRAVSTHRVPAQAVSNARLIVRLGNVVRTQAR
jgi:hypothetical protein